MRRGEQQKQTKDNEDFRNSGPRVESLPWPVGWLVGIRRIKACCKPALPAEVQILGIYVQIFLEPMPFPASTFIALVFFC
jgi:hypothetical protein